MPSNSIEPIIAALRTVLDPEVGVNVIDLGLIYDIVVKERDVRVQMTMTSQACPLGAYLQRHAERAIRARVPDAGAVEIDLVWQPAWEPAMVTPEARQLLGWRE